MLLCKAFLEVKKNPNDTFFYKTETKLSFESIKYKRVQGCGSASLKCGSRSIFHYNADSQSTFKFSHFLADPDPVPHQSDTILCKKALQDSILSPHASIQRSGPLHGSILRL